jgi:hypothetical protein
VSVNLSNCSLTDLRIACEQRLASETYAQTLSLLEHVQGTLKVGVPMHCRKTGQELGVRPPTPSELRQLSNLLDRLRSALTPSENNDQLLHSALSKMNMPASVSIKDHDLPGAGGRSSGQ